MKTLKVALIAVFLGFSMAGSVYADGIKSKSKRAVNLSFGEAMKNPGLAFAVRQNVDPAFLNKPEKLYIVKVNYNAAIYRILGSRDNWLRFFNGPIPGTGEKAKAKNDIYRID